MTALGQPEWRTVAEVRQRKEPALVRESVTVVPPCREARMVKPALVTRDPSKIRAASSLLRPAQARTFR